jgi:hypothetical protein
MIDLEGKHLDQWAKMDEISSLLKELKNNSTVQSDQIQASSQAMGALTQSLSEISGGMKEFAQSLRLSGHGLPNQNRSDEHNKQMIAALEKLSRQGQFQNEQAASLFSELMKKIGSLDEPVRSDGRTDGSQANDAFALPDYVKINPRQKERRPKWKQLIATVWPWGK